MVKRAQAQAMQGVSGAWSKQKRQAGVATGSGWSRVYGQRHDERAFIAWPCERAWPREGNHIVALDWTGTRGPAYG